MIGAIIGDIVGSVYEVVPTKSKEFALFPKGSGFTDDTVHTVAIADSIVSNCDPVDNLHEYFDRYPHAGYGKIFGSWAKVKDRDPYNSYGNGSAMRISSVGWYYDSIAEVESNARRVTGITHNHPDAIKAGIAVAGSIFMARMGSNKTAIMDYVKNIAGYKLEQCLNEIRPNYSFKVDCIFSVPEAIQCFLEAENYLDAIRNAVSLGGDADTQACIAGSIAEAYYGMPDKELVSQGLEFLDDFLRDKAMGFWNDVVREKYKRT
jgi:ADP-ribosylglycohydrolase